MLPCVDAKLPVVTNTSAAIVVEKGTSEATTQNFHFEATGDGLPAAFSLSDGESIMFDGLAPGTDYDISELVPDGWDVRYATSNASLHTAILVEADTVTTLTVTNGSNTRVDPIRRERWFPVLNQEQMRMFFSYLQIDLQAGNGITVGQGSNPILELDWSDDGGWTWSNLHLIETGKLGEYNRRAIARRLGTSRQRVFRIAVTDPVQWVILDGYMKMTMGTS